MKFQQSLLFFFNVCVSLLSLLPATTQPPWESFINYTSGGITSSLDLPRKFFSPSITNFNRQSHGQGDQIAGTFAHWAHAYSEQIFRKFHKFPYFLKRKVVYVYF
jgi:hypothetical protein